MCNNKNNNCKCDSEVCGCDIKISPTCVIYNNKDLGVLGVQAGDNLEKFMKNTDDYLANLNNNLNNNNKEVFVEEFTGKSTVILSQNITTGDVLNVYLEGVALPINGYTVELPNKIVLLLNVFNIGIDNDDKVKVIYKK